MDKRDTVRQFQVRLEELVRRSGLSRAAFAHGAGLDRSTLTQLLSEHNVRLPRAETIARIAARYATSVDWLLGLSQQDQVAADIVPQLVIEPGTGRSSEELLERWHDEIRGYKVRYVPSSLPDQLKIEAVLAYEAGRMEAAVETAFRETARVRTEHAHQIESEIEAASSVQSLEEFARGEGVWRDLPAACRREQLEHMSGLLDASYPAYRLYLYDARECFAVPYTVFGLARAAIYMGDMYFVFTSTEHIRELTRHFDSLIRRARIQAHECGRFVHGLIELAA